MKTPDICSKCKRCLHSRFIASENGIHPVCTLPTKQAVLCAAGIKDKYLGLEEVGGLDG